MDDMKRTQWRRVLRIAYEKPLAKRWRKDDVSVLPSWFFDSIIIVSCVTLALLYYFGVAGVVVAFSTFFTLFLLWKTRKGLPRWRKKARQ